MSIVKNDGGFTTATIYGPRRYSAPLPTNEFCVYEQTYMQLLSSFAAATIPSAGPDSGWYLIEESAHEATGPIIKWTRKYAKIPTSHDEWETYALNMIGIVGSFGINVATATGRERRVDNVTSRIQHDYFLVQPSVTETSTIKNSVANIPRVRAFLFCGGTGIAESGNLGTLIDYTFDYTCPTTTTWRTMIKNAASQGFDRGASDANIVTQSIDATTGVVTMPGTIAGGQICIEDSRISRWGDKGPIYVRQTRYVLAE